jgi:hypothetical protein
MHSISQVGKRVLWVSGGNSGWEPWDHTSDFSSGARHSDWSSGHQCHHWCSSTAYFCLSLHRGYGAPTLEQLRDFFHAHPQGHEWAYAFIKISAFSPPHRLFAKIVLHNLWPIARRSELMLKMTQFLYALCMSMPFCLCKHILNLMLEMRDEHTIGFPYACLITKLIIQSGIDVSVKPMMRIQDSLGSQTFMKPAEAWRSRWRSSASTCSVWDTYRSFLFSDCSSAFSLWCWICSDYGCIELS